MEYTVAYGDLVAAEDEQMISYYLKTMINTGNLEEQMITLFRQDLDVYNKDPSEVFDPLNRNPKFVYVKTRTETCGTTDGCESGCWRTIGRDKLIKSEESGKFLGFKKILKFCEKRKARNNKRSWVMEEYRVVSKWNRKQDKVICKIRQIFETEISFLLAKHLSYPYVTSLIPAKDESYMNKIKETKGNYWPSYYIIAENVYCVEPWSLASVTDDMFIEHGSCFYVNKTDACGRTDGCEGGCWRIMEPDRLITSPTTGKILYIKRVLKYCEKVKREYLGLGEKLKVTWTMEEYRLAEEEMQYKVLCVIKLRY